MEFFTVVALIITMNLNLHFTSAAIGTNYGLLGDNLPAPSDVIALYKNQNIPLLRLFEPNPDVLNALRGSSIRISLGVKNEDVPNIASDQNAATAWVNTNVVPFSNDVDIEFITLGNEMVPGAQASSIPQAMDNMLTALKSIGLTQIKVSTVVHASVITNSSPPSATYFHPDSIQYMKSISNWLDYSNNPLLINVYSYYAYTSDPDHIPLDFALFNATDPIIDGDYKYYTLFEALVDSFYVALEKIGRGAVKVVVAETGWPTAGNDPYTSVQNAQLHNQRLIDKFKTSGTPKRPNDILDVFIFSMFNEDQKPVGVEQNWGIYYPNMNPVYPLTF